MKKQIIILAIVAALAATNISAYAATIPRESVSFNATEQQIQITENLISDILDEVQAGRLGYTLAAGYANTRIRKAVIANQTDGNGYGILSPIAQNAIRTMRDMQLRADYYKLLEEKLSVLLADLIVDVQNDKDYATAYEEARTRIYKSADASFNPDMDMVGDFCYWNVPPVDSTHRQEGRTAEGWLLQSKSAEQEVTVARKLLLAAKK